MQRFILENPLLQHSSYNAVRMEISITSSVWWYFPVEHLNNVNFLNADQIYF